MFLFASGAGLSSPAALSKSLGVDPTLVGSAAGMYGFMQMAVDGLGTWFASAGQDPAWSVACAPSVAALLGKPGSGWLALGENASPMINR